MTGEPFDYSIFDSFVAGVQVISRDYQYVYVNASAARHGRSTVEALTGTPIASAYPRIEKTPMFQRLRDCLEDRTQAQFINQFEFSDGSRQYFGLQMEPVQDGALILSVDVADEHAHHVLTERLGDEVERIVEQRTAQLQARIRELDRIAYTASHDLKAPLRTIAGFSQVLQEEYAAELSAGARGHLARIEKAAGRMKATIEALLDHARLGSGRTLETVALDEVMRDVEADLAADLQEHGAKLEFGGLPVVQGFATELRLLLQNLVENALTYRREGVPPVVEVRAQPEWPPPGAWRISVSDNGRGIAPKDEARVFGVFERAAADANPDGLGMGLAHCEKIVRMHGGKLWLQSTPGQGTTFHFVLPPPPNEAGASGSKRKLEP